MGLGYGSQIELAQLSGLEVGAIEKATDSHSIWTFLRILITIAEVGLSMVPGVGAIASTGIILASGAANTAIDIAETGKVTPVSLALNFGAAAIPSVGAGIRNIKSAALWNKFVAGEINEGQNALNLATSGSKEYFQAANYINDFENAAGGTLNPFTNSVKSGTKDLLSSMQETRNFILPKDVFSDLSRDIIKAARREALGRGIGETGEGIGENIEKIEMNSGITRAESKELSRLLRSVVGAEDQKIVVVKFLKSIGKLDKLRELAPLATDAELAYIMRNGERLLAEEPLSIGAKTSNKVRNYIRSLGKPNSREFNDNFVQKVQLLFDGNDAGRAPIEFAYGKIKRYINKEFSKLSKIINRANKLDDVFTKTGGTLVTSDVIIGYKIIQSIGYQNLVQITFYPEPTLSAKNPSGKEPVFVFANKQELKRLRSRGMSYYLKKWATSKNGRTGLGFGAGVRNILGGLTFFSGFFKINAIRNILSLASNVSTGFFGKGGIAEHGMFTGGWEAKFTDSFSRNWKNRLGRLTGRAIIGGAAGALFGHSVGSFVGREAQRASSQYIIPMLTGKNPGSVKNALATAFQSNLRRFARHRATTTGKTNLVVNSLSQIRNGGIVQRTPGSFTAGKAALTNWKIPIIR